MTPDADPPISLLHFMEVESFINPNRGRPREEVKEETVARALSFQPRVEITQDWPRISRVIRRGSLFVIEAKSLQYTALLRFDPNSVDSGDYQVRYNGKMPIETGRTTVVSLVDHDESDPQFSMLKNFENRYVVVTVALSRPYKKLVWRVGFDEFMSFDELEE